MLANAILSSQKTSHVTANQTSRNQDSLVIPSFINEKGLIRYNIIRPDSTEVITNTNQKFNYFFMKISVLSAVLGPIHYPGA